MPISHKIRQYRALLGFAHLGKVPGSTERAEEDVPKQGIWQGFMNQILVGSLHGGKGLVSWNQVAIYHWWFPGLTSAVPSGFSLAAILSYPAHPDS